MPLKYVCSKKTKHVIISSGNFLTKVVLVLTSLTHSLNHSVGNQVLWCDYPEYSIDTLCWGECVGRRLGEWNPNESSYLTPLRYHRMSGSGVPPATQRSCTSPPGAIADRSRGDFSSTSALRAIPAKQSPQHGVSNTWPYSVSESSQVQSAVHALSHEGKTSGASPLKHQYRLYRRSRPCTASRINTGWRSFILFAHSQDLNTYQSAK